MTANEAHRGLDLLKHLRYLEILSMNSLKGPLGELWIGYDKFCPRLNLDNLRAAIVKSVEMDIEDTKAELIALGFDVPAKLTPDRVMAGA
jgi:hypothetical protein